MSGQYYEEKPFGVSDNNEESNSKMNDPLVNPSVFADKVPMDNGLTDEQLLPQQVPQDMTTAPYTPPSLVENAIVDESVVSGSAAYHPPMDETISPETPVSPTTPVSKSLFTLEESDQFRARWNEIQAKFVDEPRAAVLEADKLVSDLMENITRMFDATHSELESQWKAVEVVSTEDLRKALQLYRSFFNRLLG